MPNFDGGHYFLTTLVPIRTDTIARADGSITSCVHAIREVFATLPTAQQSKACVAAGQESPFARNLRTHFARFAVIDDAAFNGRDPKDALLVALVGPDPAIPRPVDSLGRPYLMFSADFDAGGGDPEAGLTRYLSELWGAMSVELRAIFSHCYGFSQVADAEGFCAYIRKCQVETTMPFNDYWTGAPPLPSLPLGPFAIGCVAAAAALGLGVAHFGLRLPLVSLGSLGMLILFIAIGLAVVYATLLNRGAKPFPTAPGSDLPSVLKALYLQQRFTEFVIANQGAAPAALQSAFRQFVSDHQPAETSGPTQTPGTVNP